MPRTETATILNVLRELQRKKPNSFSTRQTGAETLQRVRESNPSVEALEIRYLYDVYRVLTHPALQTLANRGEITVALIKPNVYEGKNLRFKKEKPAIYKDNQAANTIRYHIQKPFITKNKETQDIISEDKGEILIDLNMQFTPDQVGKFYEAVKNRKFDDPEQKRQWKEEVWPRIEKHMSSGPVTFLLLRHLKKDQNNGWKVQQDAVNWWRRRMGATNPQNASPDTLRGRFARSIGNNIVHGSDAKESAGREAKLVGEFLLQHLPKYLRASKQDLDRIAQLPDALVTPKTGTATN